MYFCAFGRSSKYQTVVHRLEERDRVAGPDGIVRARVVASGLRTVGWR